jgi:hypothetical protein
MALGVAFALLSIRACALGPGSGVEILGNAVLNSDMIFPP